MSSDPSPAAALEVNEPHENDSVNSMGAEGASSLEAEDECRVCRGGHSSQHPLKTPCKCTGSIAFVHQDCLEHWLAHSHKDTCELCSSKYKFEPEYAEGTPTNLPIHLLLLSALRIIFMEIILAIVRFAATLMLWLVVVPIATSWLYRAWIRGNMWRAIEITKRIQWAVLADDVTTGIVLTGTIIVSFVIMVRRMWPPVANRVASPIQLSLSSLSITNHQHPLTAFSPTHAILHCRCPLWTFCASTGFLTRTTGPRILTSTATKKHNFRQPLPQPLPQKGLWAVSPRRVLWAAGVANPLALWVAGPTMCASTTGWRR